MRSLAARLQAQGKSVINLAAGELVVDAPDALRLAAVRAILSGSTRYTETVGMPELRAALARRMAAQTGLDWTPEHIAVTAGAKQALFNTAMALFDEGDEVIVPTPHWTTFPAQIRLAGATPVLLDTAGSGFGLDAERLRSLVTPRTRAVVINTPHNPTGHVASDAELAGIAAVALEHGLWVVFDQCYADFVHEGHRHVSILTVAPQLRARTVVIDSFSKSHAVAGWRIGFLAGPAALVSAVAGLQSHTTSNPSSIAQAAVLDLLNAPRPDMSQVHAMLEQGRARAVEALSAVPGVRVQPPQGGFYLYLNTSGMRLADGIASARIPHLLLQETGVAVVGGSAFGDPGGLRLSYALPADELAEGLRRLAAGLCQLGAGRA
jgi:aspartate aminotransferase